MASVKEQAIRIISSLPEDATLDDIMAELYFKMQVDSGLRELDEGEGIPHQEVKTRLAKWLDR